MKVGPTKSDLGCLLSDGVRLCSLFLCTVQTVYMAVNLIFDYNMCSYVEFASYLVQYANEDRLF